MPGRDASREMIGLTAGRAFFSVPVDWFPAGRPKAMLARGRSMGVNEAASDFCHERFRSPADHPPSSQRPARPAGSGA